LKSSVKEQRNVKTGEGSDTLFHRRGKLATYKE